MSIKHNEKISCDSRNLWIRTRGQTLAIWLINVLSKWSIIIETGQGRTIGNAVGRRLALTSDRKRLQVQFPDILVGLWAWIHLHWPNQQLYIGRPSQCDWLFVCLRGLVRNRCNLCQISVESHCQDDLLATGSDLKPKPLVVEWWLQVWWRVKIKAFFF